MKEEILVVKKGNRDKLKFKVVDKKNNEWNPKKYEKILSNRDYKMLALLFYDMNNMGYPIEKAFVQFKNLLDEPELFFL